MRRRCVHMLATIALCICGGNLAAKALAASTAPRPQHVFIIVLENESFGTTFGANSDAPYLSKTLPSQGELLTEYYATGHYSLDNYISMVSGQAPTPETQADCIQSYQDFSPGGPSADQDGQLPGRGCVYPQSIFTIANQLEGKGLTWGGYMEDMSRPCEHPTLDQPDDHVKAEPGDQYATRHDPFVYFHSIIDHPTCSEHVVPLTRLSADLKSIASTPNLVFITPNLCHDGHDGPSKICPGGHLKSADGFLREWVPKILESPAFEKDGILIITFDEADVGHDKKHRIDPKTTDATACCGELSGPNTTEPGQVGPGGGKIGALILSQYVQPGSKNDTPYNHYALLRGLEDWFGLNHLGYAQRNNLNSLAAIFNQPPRS